MPGDTSIERAVEVVRDRGPEEQPRYSVGSGYMVGGPLVLSAAHNLGDGELWVRRVGGAEHTARALNLASGADVGLLEITDPAFQDAPPLAAFAQVDRTSTDVVERCSAVGFPRFKERPGPERPLRDTAHLRGVISPRANLVSGYLELEVTITPRPLPDGPLAASEWEGMSGAAVCAYHPELDSVVVGVVVEHHRPEGASSLTVVPASTILADPRWRSQLALADDRLPVLPSRTALARAPYWATVAELARRTPVLLDREQWVEYLAAAAQWEGGYVWLVGEKWSGKTALAAHFAMNLPIDVDGVTYFMVPQGDADSQRFVAVVNDQLARLLGDDPKTATGNQDELRRRWERAVDRARRQRRHLLLLVEGLDDDASVQRDLPSVASLLPRLVGDWTHVVVTSRREPSLPGDVDPAHPLYDAKQDVLSAPSAAVIARTREIEARHGLCPTCKRNDEVDLVPVIVQKGAWSGSVQPLRPLTLEAALALPAPPGERTLFHWAVALSVLLGFSVLGTGCVAVIEGSTTSDGGGSTAGVFWVVLFLVATIWLWIAYGNRRATRGPARRVWETLRFCHRDRVVFDNASGEQLYPAHLAGYLYPRPPRPGSVPPGPVRPAPVRPGGGRSP